MQLYVFGAAGDFDLATYLYGLNAISELTDPGGTKRELFFDSRRGSDLSATAQADRFGDGTFASQLILGHAVVGPNFERLMAVEAMMLDDVDGVPIGQVMYDAVAAHDPWQTIEAKLLAGDDVLSGYIGDDTLIGLAGDDQIFGGVGTDSLDGGVGDDRLFGDDGEDLCVGGSGNDEIYGGLGADRLVGSAGDDRLYGGADTDFLTGGSGRDIFHLGDPTSAPLTVPHHPGAAARAALAIIAPDTILDFNVKQDLIELDPSVFRAVRNGVSKGAFATGTGAHDGNDHLIYDPTSGHLFYDSDGTGAAAQTLIATLGHDLALTNAAFIIG